MPPALPVPVPPPPDAAAIVAGAGDEDVVAAAAAGCACVGAVGAVLDKVAADLSRFSFIILCCLVRGSRVVLHTQKQLFCRCTCRRSLDCMISIERARIRTHTCI